MLPIVRLPRKSRPKPGGKALIQPLGQALFGFLNRYYFAALYLLQPFIHFLERDNALDELFRLEGIG